MKAHIHNLIPHFIHEEFQAGNTADQFKAITLFIDISGFTTMTQAFMQRGKDGAEELVEVINNIFEPIIQTIYEHGGFVTGFAGDALTIVFRTYDTQMALTACQTALTIDNTVSMNLNSQTPASHFKIAIKQGLSAGLVEWGIMGSANHKTYFFRGDAVDNCAIAEHQAIAGDIILDENIQALLPHDFVHFIGKNGRYAKLKQISPNQAQPKSATSIRPLSEDICHRFFPQELWQLSRQGEFRQVSTVFLAFQSDLSQPLLNKFITLAIQECDQHGGHFSEVDFGDKGGLILVCFGAPKTHENDVERALSFTLSLTKKLDKLNLRYRVGITYGLVFAGLVGIPLRSKYAILGNVVNFSARLMSKAEWGQILLSSTVAQQPGFEFDYMGDFTYKGFANPIPTYRLIGQAQENQLTAVSTETPIVGRSHEREQLLNFAKPLLNKQAAGTAIVYGEAGIGKSVLTAEFQTHANQSLTWLICQTDQILRQAFNPFTNQLHTYFKQHTDATEAENKAAFTNQWQQLQTTIHVNNAPPTLIQEQERTKSILGALLGLHWEASLYDLLDGELRYENTITAVKTWLFALSCLHPVVLVIEDGHWLDDASHEVLTSISQEMAEFPIMILITSRYLDNGRSPEFKTTSQLPQLTIDLTALSPTSLRQQAEQLLNGPLNNHFFNFLRERTQANPFFSQQLLYYFKENQLLVRDHENNWTAAIDQISLPDSISAILIARIDRLSQRVKEVVQTASILGTEFEIEILSQMLKANVTSEIQQAEMNQIWRAFSELKYIFKHILLRDAAYDMQMRQHLRQLHQLAAAAYEQLYQADLSPHFATLAYHFRRGHSTKKELHYSRLAGEQSASKGNQKEAITYYSRALELAPDSEIDALLFLREEAFHLLGDRENQATDLITLTRRIMLAPKSAPSDRTQPLEPASPAHLKRQVEVILHQIRYRSAISDYSASAIAAQRALHLSQEAGDDLLEIRSRYWWGESLVRQARYQDGVDQLEKGLRLLQAMDNPDTTARFIKELGWIAFREGNPNLATRHLKEALQLVKQSGNQREQMMVLKALGGAANANGDYLAARAWQEEALAKARTIGHRLEEGSLLNNLGNTCRFLGDFETAVSFHQRGLILLKKTGWRMGEAISHINLGLAFPYLGEHQKAFEHTQSGLQMAQQIHARMIQGASWYILGNIAVETNNLTEAASIYQKSIDVYRSVSLPHYIAEANAGLIRAYLAQRDYEKIKDPLSEILTFLDLGGSVSSVEEPMRVYLTCYQALNALKEPRTKQFLHQAYTLLQAQAARIPNPKARQSMLDNIPFHHEIVIAWENHAF